MQKKKNIFKNKIILVTGGTGSIGAELVRQLLSYKPRQVRVFSRNDTRQYELRESLKYPGNLRMLIGDIRDRDRLDFAFQNVDYIFHAAALKHVPLCEYNPFEAVKTNILGSQNVIDMAIKHKVKKVIAISTDKAANPTSIMGVSKLMMEKLFVNTKLFTSDSDPRFSCVRFGNVAWANGSVLPLWDRQIQEGKSISVTDKNMTRFFMSIRQAAGFVLESAVLAQGGDIFVMRMPSIKIGDLATLFLKKYHPGKNIKIGFSGSRHGEKTHESLINTGERQQRVFANKKMIIVVPSENIYSLKDDFKYSYPGFKRVSRCDFVDSDECQNEKEIAKII